MLTLKPNCECCDVDLPANSRDARICSHECTFCASCVDTDFKGICPNCTGGFEQRPIRPAKYLEKNPASTERFINQDHADMPSFLSRSKSL